ncbi:unnamed protein product [Pleuronectes platessa]|uniref:Uncharacterized protein n=1 Tax=Pleuronectes platessa TaxID=8262 RepID=A0A9N7V528_PLEPL|nr:unnamed protein product [Pleuronectes platessa]
MALHVAFVRCNQERSHTCSQCQSTKINTLCFVYYLFDVGANRLVFTWWSEPTHPLNIVFHLNQWNGDIVRLSGATSGSLVSFRGSL